MNHPTSSVLKYLVDHEHRIQGGHTNLILNWSLTSSPQQFNLQISPSYKIQFESFGKLLDSNDLNLNISTFKFHPGISISPFGTFEKDIGLNVNIFNFCSTL